MGLSTGTIAMISAGASLAGTALSAVGGLQQANAAKKAAEYNANVAEQNAARRATTGDIEASNAQMRNRAAVGSIEAEEAAKGVDAGSGSAADVQASQSELGMLDALNIRSKAVQEAYNYRTEAAMDRATAKNESKAGTISAIGKAVTGLGTVGSEYSSWLKKTSPVTEGVS
ncbi:MAG: hypothetical protein KGJ90_05935 [Patescibacteria group bacterium]|nr:hypothetical protein [Patescibacteria group bacterium]